MTIWVERRSASRYDLRVPVTFSWRDSGDSDRLRQGGGTSRDISVAGAYVCCDPGERPPMNVKIFIRVSFPPIKGSVNEIELRSVGRVKRINSASEEVGFVASAPLALKLHSSKTGLRS